MPLYHFKCKNCGASTRRFLKPAQAKTPAPCKTCQGALERDPQPPSTAVKETLDNGAMSKSLERFADAERLFEERAKAPKV